MQKCMLSMCAQMIWFFYPIWHLTSSHHMLNHSTIQNVWLVWQNEIRWSDVDSSVFFTWLTFDSVWWYAWLLRLLSYAGIQDAGSGVITKQRLMHPIANDEAAAVDYDYSANTEEVRIHTVHCSQHECIVNSLVLNRPHLFTKCLCLECSGAAILEITEWFKSCS